MLIFGGRDDLRRICIGRSASCFAAWRNFISMETDPVVLIVATQLREVIYGA